MMNVIRVHKVTGFDTRYASLSQKGCGSCSAVAGGVKVGGNAETKLCPGFDARHLKLRGPVVRGSNPVRRVSSVGCCRWRPALCGEGGAGSRTVTVGRVVRTATPHAMPAGLTGPNARVHVQKYRT
jgi:hypothetical protein